jgi:hypothetical protein
MKSAAPKVPPETRARSIQQQLESTYPDLTVSNTGSRLYIRGAFPVLHAGKVPDRYQVEIEWSDSDTEAPVLYETGGRIPWTAERHVNQNGKACIFVPEEWLMRPREQRTPIDYLDGPVRNYFLWQALFEHGEARPSGERSHGVPGLIEAYEDMVGIQGERPVRKCLEYLSKKKTKGHWPCFCGSNIQLRNCHAEHLRALQQKIPRRVARLALKRLASPLMR